MEQEDEDSKRRIPLKGHGNGLVSGRTRTVVLFLVAGVWATNFFAGLLVPSYRPDPQIHAVFMIVLGAIFASDFGSRMKGGGE